MKIWITGIAGFLGSHLAEELIKLGHDVKGNDSEICSSVPITKIQSFDCNNINFMRNYIADHETEVLIHCAATAHEGLSSFSPSFITKNIYEASVSTFSAAIATGVKRIIFMSSMARYGNGKPFVGDEIYPIGILPFKEHLWTNPVDPYGIAKVAAEDTLKVLARTHSIEYVIAIPHNIIGPRQRYNDPYRNVASIMINRALQGKPLIVYGDGKQKRCFSPIGDCLDSLVKMIDAPISGETINIGPDGGQIEIIELARMIIRLTNPNLDIIHMHDRPNEVKEAYCSSDKARRLLGYEPKQDIESCLKEMVDYIKEHGVKEFQYIFPIEIERGCPETWKNKLI